RGLRAREARRRRGFRPPPQEARELARARGARRLGKESAGRARGGAPAASVPRARRDLPVKRAAAPAKINLALVVGPRRADGLHELTTVYQRVALSDHLAVDRAGEVRVEGFDGDALVRRALELAADGSS